MHHYTTAEAATFDFNKPIRARFRTQTRLLNCLQRSYSETGTLAGTLDSLGIDACFILETVEGVLTRKCHSQG